MVVDVAAKSSSHSFAGSGAWDLAGKGQVLMPACQLDEAPPPADCGRHLVPGRVLRTPGASGPRSCQLGSSRLWRCEQLACLGGAAFSPSMLNNYTAGLFRELTSDEGCCMTILSPEQRWGTPHRAWRKYPWPSSRLKNSSRQLWVCSSEFQSEEN